MTTPIPLCIKCARFSMPARLVLSDNLHFCSLTIPVSRVTGKAIFPQEIGDEASCQHQRSELGLCGPEGTLFTTELLASDFDGIPNTGNATVNSHCLQKSSKQDGVLSGVSIAEHSVDLEHSCTQVITNDAGSKHGITVDSTV